MDRYISQSGFAGAQNEITHKMMPHCGIPVSRRRRATNPDHLSTNRAHRLLLGRGFDRRVVDPVISAWKKCSVLCDILSHRPLDVGYRGTACVARVRSTRGLENTIHFAWAQSHPIVSAERERKATRIISPSTTVVGGTDHHRRSDLDCPQGNASSPDLEGFTRDPACNVVGWPAF